MLVITAIPVLAQDPPPDGPAGLAGSTWIPQGPGPALNGQLKDCSGFNEVSGAVHALAAHPTNPDILYVGAVNGGVWKTTDARQARPSWVPLTDNQPSLSIGALEFDPLDGSHQTLVAGIGRYSSFANIGGPRTGLLRTTDGGNSWASLDNNGVLVGLNISGVAPRSNIIVASANISDDNSCSEIGIWRSTNAGVTFLKLGTAQGIPNGQAYDLASDRLNPDILYTGVSYGALCSDSVLPNGIYRSTDSGASWNKVSDTTIDGHIIDGDTNNIEITAHGQHVYVNVINNGQPAAIFHSDNSGASWSLMDLPRTPEVGPLPIMSPGYVLPGAPITINTAPNGHTFAQGDEIHITGVAGTTGANGWWRITPTGVNTFTLDNSNDYTDWVPNTGHWTKLVGLSPSVKPGFAGAIHASIVVDPGYPHLVYIGGDRQTGPFPNFIGAGDYHGRLFRGDPYIPAGIDIPSAQWDHLTHSDSVAGIPGGGTWNGTAPHADSREMVVNAEGSLVEADDSGVYINAAPTTNAGDWCSINGNLQVTEQHDIAYDALSKIIITGNQDTGTTEQVEEDNLEWRSVSLADGGDVAVDDWSQIGFSTRYSSYQSFIDFRRRVLDPSNTMQSEMFPALAVTEPDEAPIFPFITPLELNSVIPTRLVLAGLNAVYESLDQGETLVQVPGLYSDLEDMPAVIPGLQNAIAYGGVELGEDTISIIPDLLYVGSGSRLYRRIAAHPAPLEWVTTYPTAMPNEAIRDVEIHPGNWTTVFVAEDSRVMMSSDSGVSWTNITGNLTDKQLNTLAYVSIRGKVLLVGGSQGVHYLNLAALPAVNWYPFGTGLPNVPVWDLDISPDDGVLVAATLGRGAWKMQLDFVSGPEFHSAPAGGTTLDFGYVLVATPSSLRTIEVTNIGTHTLSLGCNFSGGDAGDFSLVNTNCSSLLPASSITLQVRCFTAVADVRTSTLVLTSDDPDEPSVQFPLVCRGITPEQILIFRDGFEPH